MGAKETWSRGYDEFEVVCYGNGWAYEIIEYDIAGKPVASAWFQDEEAGRLEGDCEGFGMSEKAIHGVLEQYMEAAGASIESDEDFEDFIERDL